MRLRAGQSQFRLHDAVGELVRLDAQGKVCEEPFVAERASTAQPSNEAGEACRSPPAGWFTLTQIGAGVLASLPRHALTSTRSYVVRWCARYRGFRSVNRATARISAAAPWQAVTQTTRPRSSCSSRRNRSTRDYSPRC